MLKSSTELDKTELLNILSKHESYKHTKLFKIIEGILADQLCFKR